MRDRLIELIRKGMGKHEVTIENYVIPTSDYLADYLLANGVIVPPCKVGDKVYAVDKRSGLWWHGKIISMYYCNKIEIQFAVAFDDGEVAIYDWDSVFLTKEEAEQALKGGAENGRT